MNLDAQARILEMAYRIDHRHPDGSWGEMVEDRSHHSAVDHDPEKEWRGHRIFRCTSCPASVEVVDEDDNPLPER